jgi:GAF domain-containing protein
MNTDPKLLIETLSRFATTLAGDYEVTDVLHDLTDRVTEVMQLSGAGVSLMDGERMHFVTVHNDDIIALERVQEGLQAGPCMDAARQGEVVAVSNLRTDLRRWPAYCSKALGLGVVAVAGIPLRSHNVRGALNLYDCAARPWHPEDLEIARVLADMAAGYVVHASRLNEQRHVNEQLCRALESRIIIEQAKGIVAADHGVSVDQAFKVLRKHANDRNASLRHTADAVVRLGLRP